MGSPPTECYLNTADHLLHCPQDRTEATIFRFYEESSIFGESRLFSGDCHLTRINLRLVVSLYTRQTIGLCFTRNPVFVARRLRSQCQPQGCMKEENDAKNLRHHTV